MTELLLMAPISVAFWYSVIAWIRHLNATDAMTAYRPAAGCIDDTLTGPLARTDRKATR